MKKLMIALTVAATAMFSFGAGTETAENRETLVNGATGTSFEALAEGSKTVGDIVDKTDGGLDVGDYYWYSTAPSADELGVITNDVASGVSRPDLFANQNQANTKSLQIDTTAPLVRTALPNAGASSVSPVDIDDGIYLDTLVKFTAAEEGFTTNSLTAGDKIAIEYVEHGADALTEAEPDTYTNFVIRAGLIGEELGQTNYYAYVSGDPDFTNFDKDAWHRLTVRTIADVGDGHVGFVIYLDGDPTKTLEYSTSVNAGFGTLSPLAQTFYNENKHALFPSAVEAEDIGGSTISSVAFSGNGFIDDVSFTADKPNFIKAGESVVVPFVADAGVTAISVSVAGVTDPISVVNGSATLPAQTTAFTVNVTVDTANGYTLGGISYGGTPVVDGEVTGYAGGDITVTTIRNNFNLFDENGDPIQGTFQKLSEAFAAEGVAMIKLAYDYDALAFEGEDFDGYDIDGEIVLDLNGNDLDGGDDSAGKSLFRVVDVGVLTIKDSVGGGSITYDTQYGYAIVKMDGSDAFIGAATGDAGATFNGKLFEDDYEGKIVKGYIDDANNADEGVFLWSSYVDGNSDKERVGDYWVVTPKGVIGTYTVTVTPTNNATYAVTGAASNVGDVYTVATGNSITITATPGSGYEYAETPTGWTAGQDGEITIEVSAEATVAIPAPTAKQIIGTYEVVVTPNANATYAAICTNDDSAVVFNENITTVRVGYAIMITATPNENYEYANTPEGWTAGANGVITKVVDAAGTVAIPAPTATGSYPTYIENITDPTTKAAYEAKYDIWKGKYGADTESAYQDAFLLNCSTDAAVVAAEKAAFKFTSISYDTTESKWVTTTTVKNTSGANYNGTVVVTRYSDVGCTTASETGNFFKAELK